MKTLKFLFIAILTPLVFELQAQTPDEIIDKHLEAMGGKEKLRQVNSLYMEVTTQAMGTDISGTVIILNGKGYKSESIFNGQTIIQSITDTAGWAINPMMGQSTPTPMPRELFKSNRLQLSIEPLLDYAAKGNTASLLGTEKIGDATAYKIKLTTADSVTTTYLIDSVTYYITKTITTAELMGQQMEVTATYSNFRRLDFGITIPFTIESDFGGQFSYTANVTKAEVNNPVDPNIFKMPGQ